MKKVVAVLLTVAMVLSMAACSGGGKSEKTKLTMSSMIMYNEEQIKTSKEQEGGQTPSDRYYEAVYNSVKEKYPDYELEVSDWGWAEALDEKQRALIAAGSAPDIVAGETFIPEYAAEGILEPLPQDIVDMVNPSFLVYDNDGKAVAAAYKSSIFVLFYNKDLMAAAGLDPETPPTTWDEWKEMSDKVTAAGNGEFYGGGIPSFPHAGGTLRATPFFRQLGTDFADKDGNDNLNDPKLQQTLEFIRTMNANFPEGLGNGTDESPLWDACQQGTVCFAVNGAWFGADLTKKGINWGVAPLPTYDGTEGNCCVGAVYLAVSKDSKNKEAAFNVLRENFATENEKIWLETTCPVGNKEIINTESYWKDDVVLSSMMPILQDGKYSGLAVFPKNNASIWEIVCQQVLQRATMTDDPIADICSDATEQISKLK